MPDIPIQNGPVETIPDWAANAIIGNLKSVASIYRSLGSTDAAEIYDKLAEDVQSQIARDKMGTDLVSHELQRGWRPVEHSMPTCPHCGSFAKYDWDRDGWFCSSSDHAEVKL